MTTYPAVCEARVKDGKLENEVWAFITDYEGLYQISSLGRVRRIYKTIPPRILKLSVSKGYAHVSLSKKNRVTTHRVARMVAEAFIPNPLGKPEVNHKDGIKVNNWVCNLEWATKPENKQHAHRLGLASYVGERNGQARLTEREVVEIRRLYREGHLQIHLAREFGVSKGTISDLTCRRTWPHLSPLAA